MAAISITASSVLPSTGATKDTYVSAVAITAGQACYLLANGTVGLCDSDATSPAYTLLGLACNSCPGAGQPVEVATFDPSFTLGGTIAAGTVVLTHPTAGAVTSTVADNTTGSFPAVVGIGIGSNKIYLKPINGGAAVP